MLLAVTQGRSQNSILWSESSGISASIQKTFCATDLIGNIYLASTVNGNGFDIRVVSWRPDSVLRWTYTYDGTSHSDDVVTGIVVDSLFGVYVCGTTTENGNNDITLIAIDSAGHKQWSRNFDRSGGLQDLSSGITAVGNNIYLCGSSFSAPTGFDYIVLKYNKTGTLLWSKPMNGSGNGDDYCNAIDLDHHENVYVTGKATVAGGTTDVLTASWSAAGIFAWSSYYGFKAGQNDAGTALTADANGQIYVAGQSYVSAPNSDLIVIKYLAANGNQKWAARYNGTYSGHDYAAAIIAASDNSIYVTGSTQTAGFNVDFLTIHYRASGKVDWMQKYEGPGSGVDDARAILEDGDDVVVTGRSMGIKNTDVTTISYKKQNGNINWTIRYDAAFGEAEDVASIARDEMGNILVGCFSQSGVFVNQPELVKINQKEKNDVAIERDLRLLSFGYAALRDDTIAKRILWDDYYGSTDTFVFCTTTRFVSLCESQGHSVIAQVNANITSNSSWTSAVDIYKILGSRIYIGNFNYIPAIVYHQYYHFTRDAFINAYQHVGYQHNLQDYPLPCVTSESGQLSKSEMLSVPTVVLEITVGFLGKSSDTHTFIECLWKKSTDPMNNCAVCGGITPFGAIDGPIASHGTQSHEIGIMLSTAAIGDPWSYAGYGPEDCYEVWPFNLISSWNYAILKSLPGFRYYIPSFPVPGDDSYMVLTPTIYPIHDRVTNAVGNYLTLCERENLFNAWPEMSPHYALAMGGVFELSNPITGMRPLYFAFPFSRHLWYRDGADMNMGYTHTYTDVSATRCLNGNFAVEENYFIGPTSYALNGTWLYGMTSEQSKAVIATTDLATISNFWLDNVITVGFNTNGNSAFTTCEGNVYTFYANNLAQPCSLSSYGNITQVGHLGYDQFGNFEVRRNFTTGTYAPGTQLLIHVTANFGNGETIDECRLITINPDVDSPTDDVRNIAIDFRGSILEQTAGGNYGVDIYSIP